jgi:hypothetical protein
MSRLESAIRRLSAQRDCLDLAVHLIERVSGPVLELGLGNGRTFDHLRTRLPGREIFVFERQVAAHPDCVPDPAHLVLGDFIETLPANVARFGRAAALIHADFGTGDRERNAALAERIAAHIAAMATVGGIVASGQSLAASRLIPLPLPGGVAEGKYFLYRAN